MLQFNRRTPSVHWELPAVRGEKFQGPAAGLAICQFDDDDAYYLFGCDADWNAVTDTWHQSLGDAKEQAEFEYEGIAETGQSPT